jgi:hypothetical protein
MEYRPPLGVSYARWIGSGRPQLTQSKPRLRPRAQGAARQGSAEDADMRRWTGSPSASPPRPRRGSPCPWLPGDEIARATSSESFEFEMTTLLLAVASPPFDNEQFTAAPTAPARAAPCRRASARTPSSRRSPRRPRRCSAPAPRRAPSSGARARCTRSSWSPPCPPRPARPPSSPTSCSPSTAATPPSPTPSRSSAPLRAPPSCRTTPSSPRSRAPRGTRRTLSGSSAAFTRRVSVPPPPASAPSSALPVRSATVARGPPRTRRRRRSASSLATLFRLRSSRCILGAGRRRTPTRCSTK